MADKTSRLVFELFGRDNASPVFDKFGRKVRDNAKDLDLLGRATRGVVGAAAGYIAFDRAADFLRDANEEAREAQKVGARTENVILTTGKAANVTATEVGDLANAISLKTGIDDEQIQSSANLVLTFKNVRNELGEGNKVFDRATKAAVDLAAAGFGSTESGAKMLGKALNDPLKGISALGRAGVTFTQQQKDQIATYVKQNDLLSAQKMILREVESQVGGAAEAQATAGEKAEVAWANVKEEIGTALLPTIDKLSEKFVDFVGTHDVGAWAEDAAEGIRDFGADMAPLAKDTLPILADGLEAAADAARALAPPVKSILNSFAALPEDVQKAIIIGGAAAAVGGKVKNSSLGNAVSAASGAAAGRAAAGKAGAGAAGGAAGRNAAGLLAGLGLTNPWTALAGGTAAFSLWAYNSPLAKRTGSAQDRAGGRNVAVPGMAGPAAISPVRGGFGSNLNPKELAEAAEYAEQHIDKLAATSKREKQGLISLFTDPAKSATTFGEGMEALGKIDAKPGVTLNNKPALRDISETLSRLEVTDRKNARPRVTVQGKVKSVGDLAEVGARVAALGARTARPNIQLQGYSTAIGQLGNIGAQIARLSADAANIAAKGGGKKRATGGPIFGPGTATSDDVLVWASNGEHMLTAADVTALGGHAGVFALRRRLHAAEGRAAGGPIGSGAAAPVSPSAAAIGQAVAAALQGATFQTDSQGRMRLALMGA